MLHEALDALEMLTFGCFGAFTWWTKTASKKPARESVRLILMTSFMSSATSPVFGLVKLNTKPFSQNLFVFFVFVLWGVLQTRVQTLFH